MLTVLYVKSSCYSRMCPIFQVSNVTGSNLDLLKMFLNLLSTRVKFNESEPAEFQIDDTFSVPVSCNSYCTQNSLKSQFFFSFNIYFISEK